MDQEKNTNLKKALRTLNGIFLIFLGGLVIYGWNTHNLSLIQIHSSFVPMQYNTALCFVLLGIALLLLAFNFLTISRFIFFLIFSFNFFNLIEHFFNINFGIDQIFIIPFTSVATLHPGRIPPNTAFGLILISVVLSLRSERKQSYYFTRFSLFLSILIFSFGFPVLVGYLIEIKSSSIMWGSFSFMAFQDALAFTFLGITFFLILIREKTTNFYRPALLPGIFVLCITMILGQLFIRSDQKRISKDIQSEMNRLKNMIQINLEERIIDLDRIVARAEAKNRQEEWKKNLDSFIRLSPFYIVVAELNPSFEIKQIISDKIKSRDLIPIIQEKIAPLMKQSKKQSQEKIFTTFNFENEKELGILIPIQDKFTPQGFIFGILPIRSLLDRLFDREETKSHFSIIITEKDKVIYSFIHSDEFKQKNWEQSQNFSLTEAVWSIHLRPTSTFLLEEKTSAPNLILLFGIFNAAFIPLLLLFAHKIKLQTEEIDQDSESLTQLNAFMKAILDGANYSIISTNLDGTITSFNSAAERMLGYRAEEVIGRKTPEMIHDRDEIEKRAKELSKELGKTIQPGFEVFVAKPKLGQPDEREWSYIRKDKSHFPVLLSVTPIYSFGKKIIGFMGIASDITKRQESEKQVQEATNQLNLALRAGKIGTWSWNVLNDSISVDHHIYPLFNLNEKNFPKTLEDFLKLIHPEDQERASIEINRSLKEHTELNTNWRILWPDQTVHVLASRGETYFNEKGEPIKMTGISFDITKEKEIEKMKNEFISTVSHELRTPLTSIRGSLAILANGMAGEMTEKAKKLLEIGTHGCERLIRLINDILDLEKIESGKIEMKLTPTLLLPLIKQAIEINQINATTHHIKLILEKEISDVLVNVNSDKLIQAITNLLSNAIKFSPENGIVKINMTRQRSSIRISVIDEGPGISEKFKSRIFQKFSQADSSDSRHQGGTGLGLSIAKGIIEKMNGQISFETSSKGSIFYLDLPEWHS